MATVRIGISGWNYDDWRGTFYPLGLPRSAELRFAARAFDTIEINGSFYSLRRPADYRRWYEAAPRGFRYAVKGGRFITHQKRLKSVDVALANFFASGVLELREKLGPFLWQLPPHLRFDADRLEAFLMLLPRDAGEAARLARRHDDRLREAATQPHDPRRRLRHVLEPRHESFFTPEAMRILRRHRVALAFSPSPAWPHAEQITAGFVYVRLHGSRQVYASRYTQAELDSWAHSIRQWHRGAEPNDAVRVSGGKPPPRSGRDVYVYFDNDRHGHAPTNAAELGRLLAVASPK